MTDCVFIGHNDGHFPDYVDLIRSLDSDLAAWRRLSLSFVEIDGVPHRSMDVINRYNGRDGGHRSRLTNLDAFSPTIAYLVSYVARRGFSTDYVHLFQEEKENLARLLQDDVLAVAISTTLYVGTWWLDEVIAFVREHNPSATIIVGGPYIYNQSVFSSA